MPPVFFKGDLMLEDPRPPIPPAPPQRRPRHAGWVLLLLIPALLCLLSLTLAVQALDTRWRATRPQGVEMPVTGGPTATPPVILTPTLDEQPAPDQPRSSDYGLEVEMRLSLCSEAFQHFFVIQHLVNMQPGLVGDDGWRTDAQDAVAVFQRDCALDEDLPQAPAAYSEVDRWMRLAATEVDPAAESFASVLDSQALDGLSTTSDHLERFYVYTMHAEEAIRLIRNRREI